MAHTQMLTKRCQQWDTRSESELTHQGFHTHSDILAGFTGSYVYINIYLHMYPQAKSRQSAAEIPQGDSGPTLRFSLGVQ